ncbi:regulatory protein, luxR family [Stigmatella aurantiaca]|uniref:Regulatory protein, luxR family n=1 Tax=Stigmatella aurantiaca TaxID=41 RepID=A0A1H7YD37_STIAU|nr:LuxR C-terminal-related transcriptional regulator [Stigmatella aurantiaca]SEM43099.1 regulatory protein, luxR family [Stigmatella aurantiaca]
MSRLPQRTFLDLTCGLLESQSLAQLQERTESLLAKLFHADHVAFCRMHPDLPTGFEWKASTTGHFLQSYYQWYQEDFVFRWLSQRPNTAWRDTEMLRGQKLVETATHRRSRESHLNLKHVLAVLMVSGHQLGSGALALYRERASPFPVESRRLLQGLTPALSGAFQNFARFDALSSHNQLLEEMLRQEGATAIVVDAQWREFFRTEAVTSLLARWFPSRSDRDELGIPRAWRARMDALMAGSVLLTPSTHVWREERGMSALEVSFTRLQRIDGRGLWELRLKEIHAIPEQWRRILTPRQFEAAALVVQGLTDKEIASKLGITEDTAKDHVQSAYKRLNVPNRSGLIALALRS